MVQILRLAKLAAVAGREIHDARLKHDGVVPSCDVDTM